jgi:hypothetical protein
MPAPFVPAGHKGQDEAAVEQAQHILDRFSPI